MQTPHELEIAIFRAGGDPGKARVYVTVSISDAEAGMIDLDVAEREAVLRGALGGVHGALSEELDTRGVMTLSETVELV
ncbi:hypothetical protein ACGFR8_31535 [Streptomyces brevispora]|uniref:hypothetical protein n=1 Tax=Streptomyces brevispora TaxID=887462 RepID=UPI003724693A